MPARADLDPYCMFARYLFSCDFRVSERSTFWSLYVVSLRAFAGSVRFSRTIFAEISSEEAKPLLMPPLPHSSPGKTTALARCRRTLVRWIGEILTDNFR